MNNSKVLSVGWLAHVKNECSPNGYSYARVLINLLQDNDFPEVTLIGVTGKAASNLQTILRLYQTVGKRAKRRELKFARHTKSGVQLRYAVTIERTKI